MHSLNLKLGQKRWDFSECNFNLMTYKLLAVTKRAAYFNVYGHSWIFRMLSIIRTELPTALKKVTSDFRNFFMVNILQISASRVNDQFTFFSLFEVMHCGYEKRRNCVELYNMKTRRVTFTFFLRCVKNKRNFDVNKARPIHPSLISVWGKTGNFRWLFSFNV